MPMVVSDAPVSNSPSTSRPFMLTVEMKAFRLRSLDILIVPSLMIFPRRKTPYDKRHNERKSEKN